MGHVQNVLGYDSVYGQNATDLAVQLWPTFHSVVVGQGACAFAYIKNTGTVIANSVAIENQTYVSAQPSFDYLNPGNVWNVPSDIFPGETVTYSICMTNTVVQGPINWILNFYGTTAAAPVLKAAYNTFGTTWNSAAVPDPVIGIGGSESDSPFCLSHRLLMLALKQIHLPQELMG